MIPFDNKTTEYKFFLALTCLIVYGHLYPFQFILPSHLFELTRISILNVIYGGFTDTVSNILLFVPLGFIAVRSCRLPLKPFSYTLRITVFCFVFAFLLQLIQLFIETRVPSLLDAVLNAFGCAIGSYAGSVTKLRFFGGKRQRELWMSAPILLCMAMIFSIMLPFIPTLDVGSLKNSLKPVLLNPEFSMEKMFRYMTYWLVFCHFLLYDLKKEVTFKRLFLGITAVLISQIFIEGRVLAIAKIAGSYAALPVWYFMTKRLSFQGISWILILMLVSIHTLYALSPFEPAGNLKSFNFIPFAGFMHGSMLHNTIMFFEKLFIFGSVMWILEQKWSGWKLYTALCFSWTALIEILQIGLSGHTPEVSDPVIILLIALWLRQYRHLKYRIPVDAREDPSMERREM